MTNFGQNCRRHLFLLISLGILATDTEGSKKVQETCAFGCSGEKLHVAIEIEIEILRDFERF